MGAVAVLLVVILREVWGCCQLYHLFIYFIHVIRVEDVGLWMVGEWVGGG